MSIQKRLRKKGPVYVVHYWDPDRKKYVNRTFDRRQDAVAFEAVVTLAKRSGELVALDAGQETLAEFSERWWVLYALPQLAENTQKHYRLLLDNHVLPAIGHMQLRRITPLVISEWKDVLSSRVGAATVRKTMSMLQGIMERAVEWDRIRTNPVKAVKKPSAGRNITINVTPPDRLRKLEQVLEGPGQLLVSLVGHGGLRPGEALAARRGDVGPTTLRVYASKTGNTRYVPISDELREAIEAYGGADWLVETKYGGQWSEYHYRNWRKREYRPTAELLGLSTRPYDLRHSCASRLFGEGVSPVRIAEIMGHSLQVLLSTYVHEMEEAGLAPKPELYLVETA